MRPVTNRCGRCRHRYILARKNCRLVRFRRQPWFDYLVSTCPGCLHTDQLFLEQATLYGVQDRVHDIRVYWFEFAGRRTIQAANDHYGIKMLRRRPLTRSETNDLNRFAQWLDFCLPEQFGEGLVE